MATLIRLRRGTEAAWTAANPILHAGEAGVALDSGPRLKIGDGVTAWASLRYQDAPVFTGGAQGALAMRDTGSADGYSWLPSVAGVLVSAGVNQIPVFRPLLAADIPQLAYSSLSGLPSLGNSAALNVGTSAGTVAAGDHLHTGVYEPAFATLAWSRVDSTPTTLGGYGITDAQPLNAKLTALAALANGAGLLRNDGAGVLSWSSVVNGDITSVAWGKLTGTPTTLAGYGITSPLPVAQGGTGTATAFTVGSVFFAGASGVYAQDNANLFWDDTNNRLGIGTASPDSLVQLHVAGNVLIGATHAEVTSLSYNNGLTITKGFPGIDLFNTNYATPVVQRHYQILNSDDSGFLEFNYFTGSGTAVQSGWIMDPASGTFRSIGAVRGGTLLSDAGLLVAGTAELNGAIVEAAAIAPSQLTADTHNWNPTGLATTRIVKVSTNASRQLTGIKSQAGGTRLTLLNVGSQDLVLPYNSASSTIGNRFITPGAVSFTLRSNAAVDIWYEAASTYWRVIAP